MMGQNSGNQNRLFYSFNLDDHVPANHLLRGSSISRICAPSSPRFIATPADHRSIRS
jgi:hypothetical protein